MNFVSTRNAGVRAPFLEALFLGLAPDGGLFYPDSEPDLRAVMERFDGATPFAELAVALTEALFPEEFSPDDARALCTAAFPFSPALRKIDDRHFLLELFHGPSCAFKDFGASFLAAAMERRLRIDDERAVILVATSGDTGSAVAHAFHRRKNIDVVVLYPSGRVSPLQEKQLTTLGDNVAALEVLGSFDDCQRMVKEAFVDETLRASINLTSANSINVGRLIPQSFYYVWAAAQLDRDADGPPAFCVPSGNFGNLTAGVFAWRWGMRAARFIAASNENDVVPEYLDSGVYTPRPSVQTLANAMDVGAPSNFERLRKIFDDRQLDIRDTLSGYRASDDEIVSTMQRWYRERGLVVCPHTAAGIHAVERFRADGFTGTVVTLATAHPAKFLEVCESVLGMRPDIPARLARLLDLEKHTTAIEPELAPLRELLMERYG